VLPALDAVRGVVTNGLLKIAVESAARVSRGHGMGETRGQSGRFRAAYRDDPGRRALRRTRNGMRERVDDNTNAQSHSFDR